MPAAIQTADVSLADAPSSARSGPTTAAEYDEQMRQRATDTRDVVPRSGLVAPLSKPGHLVFTDRHGKVVCIDLAEDPCTVRPVPARAVIDLLEQTTSVPAAGKPEVVRPVPVMFGDDATVRRTIAGFRRAAGRSDVDRVRYLSAANRLTLVSSMRFSVLRPVLTRVLAHRYYLPHRRSAYRWEDWVQAWSVTSKVTRSASQIQLLHLLCTLAFDRGGAHPILGGLLATLRSEESQAWARGSSSKATATHSAYRAVTAFEDAWHEVGLCDPALVERNALLGDVAVGTVTEVEDGRGRVRLDNTPRFHETGLWAVVDGRRRRVTRTAMLAGDDQSLTMVLDVPERARSALQKAKDGQHPVVLYPQRFTMRAATPRSDNRWLAAPERPWTRREVPADVLIAGIPAE